MYQLIPLHSYDYLNKFRLKQTCRQTQAITEIKCDTEQTMKLEWLYKVESECELNSWPDSSVG